MTSGVVGQRMAFSRLTKLEFQIMDCFWLRGSCSVREVQESFPESERPAYTTVQTVVYRLERKKALRVAKRIANANIFEAVISRNDALRTLVDEVVRFFGGQGKPVMAHLIEAGRLSLDDVEEAERELRKLARREKTQ
jgi:predicted transcriptional regulator